MNPSRTGSITSSRACARATSLLCLPILSTGLPLTRLTCRRWSEFTRSNPDRSISRSRCSSPSLGAGLYACARYRSAARQTGRQILAWAADCDCASRNQAAAALDGEYGKRSDSRARCGDSARGGGAVRAAYHGDFGELAGSGECTHAACVRDQLGDRMPLIVDGGPTGRSLPTTIVDLSLGPGRWEILREGAIPTHEIVMALQR